MKKSKTFLTLLLAAILAMSSLQMPVYAAGNTTCIINALLHAFFGKDDERVRYDGHYYQFFDEGITWAEAKERCEKMGGHLVTITSEDEFDFCKTLLGDMSPKYCWMGATHTSGNWEWITGEPWSFTAWSSMENQPNGSGGGTYALMQNCDDIDFAWSWDDQGNSGISPDKKYQGAPYFQITENYCFICEWDTSEEEMIPSDAVSYGNHYYKLFDMEGSFEDAEEYCLSLGGYLAVISDQKENDFLFSYMKSCGYENAYFGFSDHEDEGVWVWLGTEEKSSYTNWASKEPNSEDSMEDYAMFYWKYPDGKWNDGNFGNGTVSDDTAFLCEWKRTGLASESEQDVLSGEDDERVRYDGHYYQLFDEGITWTEADERCKKMGGHLVTITSSEENSFITDMVKSGGKNCYWIGAALNSDGNMEWVTDESMSYSNWTKNEPDNYLNNQGYAFVFGKSMSSGSYGQWGDLSEDGSSWDGVSFWGMNNFGFICEWDTSEEEMISPDAGSHKNLFFKLFDLIM